MGNINLHNARLLCSAVSEKGMPDNEMPEFAFAGRSNAGKSSVINMVLNRKKLAYVGKTPGKTRTANFYSIDDKICLVDLPGYGFAEGAGNGWAYFAEVYFNKRNKKPFVFLLLDSRHLPSADDILMYNWLRETGTGHAILLTKSDKLTVSERNKLAVNFRGHLKIGHEVPIIIVSSSTKAGREEILGFIAEKAGLA